MRCKYEGMRCHTVDHLWQFVAVTTVQALGQIVPWCMNRQQPQIEPVGLVMGCGALHPSHTLECLLALLQCDPHKEAIAAMLLLLLILVLQGPDVKL